MEHTARYPGWSRSRPSPNASGGRLSMGDGTPLVSGRPSAVQFGEGPRPVMWRQQAPLMVALQQCLRPLEWPVTQPVLSIMYVELALDYDVAMGIDFPPVPGRTAGAVPVADRAKSFASLLRLLRTAAVLYLVHPGGAVAPLGRKGPHTGKESKHAQLSRPSANWRLPNVAFQAALLRPEKVAATQRRRSGSPLTQRRRPRG